MSKMLRRIALGVSILALVSMPQPGNAQTAAAPQEGRLVAVEASPVSTCLQPIREGDADFGNFGGFRNTCDFTVEYTYCVQNPKQGSWADVNPCQSGRRTENVEGVGPKGRSGAHLYGGTRAHWFACAQANTSKEGPAGIWGDVIFDGTLLRGKCRYDKFVAKLPTPAKPGQASQPPAGAANGLNAKGVAAYQRGDYAGAVDLWRQAVNAGDPDAAYNLGQAYQFGRGVPANPEEALKLYAKGAQAGHHSATAAYALNLVKYNRLSEALPWLEKAVAFGDRRAQYVLGVLLTRDPGNRTDSARGKRLLQLSAAQGLIQAKDALAKLDGATPPTATQSTGIDRAVRTGGTGEPVWNACEAQVMDLLRYVGNTPDNIKVWRERISMKSLSGYATTSDAEIKNMADGYEAEAGRLEAEHKPVLAGTISQVRLNACYLNAYLRFRTR